MQQYYLYIIKTYILYILVVKVVHQRPGEKSDLYFGRVRISKNHKFLEIRPSPT
jgi:hypothetical protein